MAELDVDLAGLRREYDELREVPAKRRAAEARVRDYHAKGVTVATLCDVTQLTPQRIYQLLAGPKNGNADDRGGRTNGRGTDQAD